MASIRELADAIIRQEGAFDPRSVNMQIVTRYGMWNVGHLSWAGQYGAVPVTVGGRQWAAWPSYEESYEGLLRQIRLDASKGMTLAQFISKYAPPKENPTGAYIQNVSTWTGIDPNAKLADVLEDDAPPLEGGSDVYYSDIGASIDTDTVILAGIVGLAVLAVATA